MPPAFARRSSMTRSSTNPVPRLRGVRAVAGALLALFSVLALSGCAWPLPFVMPSTSKLRSSPRKVFAHYHGQYVISQDNRAPLQDFYTTQYLNPNGFGGTYKPFGGYLRDRPLPRGPLPGNWQLTDMKTEVLRAVSAGIDGFIVNAGPLTAGYYLDRVKRLMAAAQSVSPGFRIILMPDFAGQPLPDPRTLAFRVNALKSWPALYRLPDSRLVISPWAPDKQGVAYWSTFKSQMQALGTSVALVPTFIDLWGNARKFAPITYGMGSWGGRSPGATGAANPYVQAASFVHSLGRKFMQAVSVQDVRPTQQLYWEAENTENLRYTWNSAIAGNADFVQMATWNDYGEGTQFSPSMRDRSSFLDLSSYYVSRFKTGAWPRIVKSGAYVTHRTQFAAAKPDPSGGNTKLMKPNMAVGQSTAPRDTIEVLTFLTAASNVTVTIGSKVYRYLAFAGYYAKLLPLGYGSVTVTARGPGVSFIVRSPFPVRSSFQVQDLQYRAASSYRP
jgi:hypothetical protein